MMVKGQVEKIFQSIQSDQTKKGNWSCSQEYVWRYRIDKQIRSEKVCKYDEEWKHLGQMKLEKKKNDLKVGLPISI